MLINNAGIVRTEDVHAPAPDAVGDVVSTNLLGPLLLTGHLLPALRRQPSAAIVNVTSALAFVPKADLPTYCATKAALHSYTESLRFQLRDSRIRVVEILPPRVDVTPPADGDGHGEELADFVRAVMSVLVSRPDAREIVVDAAAALRYAERRGDYQEVYARVNDESLEKNPMKIGIGLPNHVAGVAGTAIVECARRAEQRGFDAVTTIDRLIYPSLDSVTTLALAAGATSTVALVSNVLLAPALPAGSSRQAIGDPVGRLRRSARPRRRSRCAT